MAGKVYPVGLVGERNYQAAIRRCHPGEVATICHERDNPYDDYALRVESITGEIIGYIARDHWLRDAIHEEGRGTAASIKSVESGAGPTLGVVINVTLTDDALPDRSYGKASRRRSLIEQALRLISKV